MNRITAIALAAVVAAALGAGYWLGSQRTGQATTAVAQTPSGSKPASRSARFCSTVTRWACPTPPRFRRRTRWGWTTSRFTKAKKEASPMRQNRSRSAAKKSSNSACAAKPPRCASLSRSVHAVGRIEIDERLSHTVAPKFEGWIDKLYVNTTGQAVKRGQPLMDVYSPDLVSAQNEYFIARQGETSMRHASAGSAGKHETARRSQPGPAEQLGHFHRAIAGPEQKQQRQAHPHVPLAGQRHRDREKSRPGHALHAGRRALPDRRPVIGMDRRRRVRTGSGAGAGRVSLPVRSSTPIRARNSPPGSATSTLPSTRKRAPFPCGWSWPTREACSNPGCMPTWNCPRLPEEKF